MRFAKAFVDIKYEISSKGCLQLLNWSLVKLNLKAVLIFCLELYTKTDICCPFVVSIPDDLDSEI